ncbi:pyridoxamine 5'-phosphate oxidase [Anianabacter salinae]|uniref:pyridoxamine 5'-phosphate oxidase n=1 Tax=Anianabacter salinae TaxID=2851023 RepID=UPI00225DD55D|nr:pyridoxamine 5'-phosphate oxidase [Anianabacter salinae]MBV0911570.1 pyridoxamine 5'-phosphate oxidase [Anianabacter salinae]
MDSARDGIFAGDDPFEIARTWMSEAARTEPTDPNAMALATVDPEGMPNVRVVLLKEIEADAVVFYTNYDSAKGRELIASGKAAINLHWKTLGRQVRMRGPVVKEDGPQADAYYRSRAVGSRIGAWASEQSRPLASRAALMERVETLGAELGDDPARPSFWGGFRLCPLEIEFWADGEFRLHDRFRWSRPSADTGWKIQRLNP